MKKCLIFITFLPWFSLQPGEAYGGEVAIERAYAGENALLQVPPLSGEAPCLNLPVVPALPSVGAEISPTISQHIAISDVDFVPPALWHGTKVHLYTQKENDEVTQLADLRVKYGAQLLASYTDEKRYDEVTFVSAHNAYSNAQEGWVYRQQNYALPDLFKLGVRAFMLDLYLNQEEEVALCHEPNGCNKGSGCMSENEKHSCWFSTIARVGAAPKLLAQELKEIRMLLEQNPREIITLQLESHLGARGDASVNKLFAEAGLDAFLFIKTPDEPWPTLGEMRAGNKRLVVFTDNQNPHFLPVGEYQETQYSLSKYRECEMRLGDGRDATGKKTLFLLNHFYSTSFNKDGFSIFGSLYNEINAYEAILKRVQICTAQGLPLPTFLSVDFVEEGNEGGVFHAALDLSILRTQMKKEAPAEKGAFFECGTQASAVSAENQIQS